MTRPRRRHASSATSRSSSARSTASGSSYLDSASSSQKPLAVLDAMDDCYRHYYANIHRGVYTIAEEATAAYEAARAARSRRSSTRARPHEIVFTRNATEAINLVAYTWARANLRAGDAIVLIAHGAPRQRRAVAHPRRRARRRAALDPAHRRLPARPHEPRRAARRRQAARDHARCRTCSAPINDIRPLADAAHAPARSCSSTRARPCPHVAVDVQAWDADFVAFSAHKMLGPSGIGALWARHELLEAMPPFLGGGEMIRDVRARRLHHQRRAVEVRSRHPGDRRGRRLRRRRRLPRRRSAWTRSATTRCGSPRYTLDALRDRFADTLTIYGPRDTSIRGGAVSFLFDGIHAHDISQVLDEDARVRARRPPLRQAADAPARRARDDAGRRSTSTTTRPTSTCSSRRSPRPRSSSPSERKRRIATRCPASKTSTERSSSTTTARRGTAASSPCRPRTRSRGSTRCAATRSCSTSRSTPTPTS